METPPTGQAKPRRKRISNQEQYERAKQQALDYASRGLFWPSIRYEMHIKHLHGFNRLDKFFEIGLEGLPPLKDIITPVSIVESNADVPELVATRFNRALFATGNSVLDQIIQAALDPNSPKQTKAWEFCLQYGIGLPAKSTRDASIQALAQTLAEQLMRDAIQKAKESQSRAAMIDVTVVD